MRGPLVATLVAIAVAAGCGGGSEPASPPTADIFTKQAARAALSEFLTTADPEEFCSFLEPRAEHQIVEPRRRQLAPSAHGCPDAMRAIAATDLQLGTLGVLTAKERRAVDQPVRLDPKRKLAYFVNRFQVGVVMQLTDDGWKVAGVATGD